MKTNNLLIKCFLGIVFIAFTCSIVQAQSFNDDKVAFANFLKRMHNSAPFEGVKVVDDYNQQYVISVISLEKAKYNNPSIMNRVAQIKAQSQVNTFLNGATISSDIIIKSTERKSNNTLESTIETIESIKQNSYGFTQGLELLTTFENTEGNRTVFIYMRELKKEKIKTK